MLEYLKYVRLWPCLVILLAGSGLFPEQLAAAGEAPPALRPGAPVEYRDLAMYPQRWKRRGISTQLVPWTGEHLIFLTTAADLDGQVMARFVNRLDAGWKLYAELTGRTPELFRQLQGKPIIAAVPDAGLSCGFGCGYLGATGIEVGGFYQGDYPLAVSKPDAFAHYYFYEMGRNYYTFGERHSGFITGYAVFMRYVCMDALHCQDPERGTREVIEKAEELHSRADMAFLPAFTTLGGLDEKAPRLKGADGQWIQPSDQPVLYASAMLKLRRDYGGDAWVKRFFAELAKCPENKRDQADAGWRQSLGWLVAASCAARKDLSGVFVDRWRLPLDAQTRQTLAGIDWNLPQTDAPSVLQRIRQARP